VEAHGSKENRPFSEDNLDTLRIYRRRLASFARQGSVALIFFVQPAAECGPPGTELPG
jgi:hypothetical protein